MEDSKKIYQVIPNLGIGPVRLGMNRTESRVAMNLPVRPFQKALNGHQVDGYHDSAFQIFFDSKENIEYIELSKTNSFVTLYEGLNIHETKADDVVAFIKKFADFDENNPELGYNYVFPTLEMSVWRPILPEKDQPSEDEDGRFFMTLGIGISGYFK